MELVRPVVDIELPEPLEAVGSTLCVEAEDEAPEEDDPTDVGEVVVVAAVRDDECELEGTVVAIVTLLDCERVSVELIRPEAVMDSLQVQGPFHLSGR